MSNLMYLASSGISAGQAALDIIGNNLNNATTPGYNRRNIMLGENGGRATNTGFFGYGVQVDGVQRSYDAFINNQMRGAYSSYSQSSTRYQALSGIDNLFSDVTNNVSTSLDDLFDGMQGIIDKPDDGPARTNVMAQFKALANQLSNKGRALDEEFKGNSTSIDNTVKDVNDITSSLAKLNKQIAQVQAQSGTQPADLLDQRDSLLDQLSTHLKIRVNEEANGVVNVTLSNGTQLVNNTDAYSLSTKQDPTDPSKLTLFYNDAAGHETELDQSDIAGGDLAGYLQYRNEDLTSTRNQLNEIALQMANRFNEINEGGLDKNGDPGQAIFGFDTPVVKSNSSNQGDAALSMSYSDISQVQAQDYTITYKNGDWEVTTADGSKVNATLQDGELQFDGISVKVDNGTPQEGDSFQLNPTEGIASSMSVELNSGDEIAAADLDGGEGNNENIKKMFDIKTEKLVNGSTLSDAYGSLVSDIGSRTSEANSDNERDDGMLSSYSQQKQSLVGVDMNEEYVNLQMYQQYYQANAQMLNTANTLFDSILGAIA